MTPERFRRVDQLVSLALHWPADERAAFIREACAGEEDLRIEVESLLATQEREDDFLAESPTRLGAQLLAESAGDNASMQPILYPPDIKNRWPQIFPVLEHEQIDLIRSLGGPPRR